MSDKTFDDWLKKYYPISASEFKNASDEECIRHSLLKWAGLTDLKEYGLRIDAARIAIVDDSYVLMRISGSSCALCVKHNTSDSCGECPLMKSLGVACGNANDSLFDKSLDEPDLMVNALLKLLEESECMSVGIHETLKTFVDAIREQNQWNTPRSLQRGQALNV